METIQRSFYEEVGVWSLFGRPQRNTAQHMSEGLERDCEEAGEPLVTIAASALSLVQID